MARIRTIKPEFWTDERLTECSLSARLMFIGMWNFADDNGNMGYSAKRIKMQVFPGDSIETQPLIDELLTHGVLIEYSVNGEKFLHIKGFAKHQVINRPSQSAIPKPDFTDDSVSVHGRLIDGKEGNGMEEEDKSSSAAQQPKAKSETQKAKRLPSDWTLPKSWGDWTLENMGWPESAVRIEGEKFRDYWTAKGGREACKTDWLATWRNWCRNAKTPAAAPVLSLLAGGI